MCGRYAVDIHLGVIEEVFDLVPESSDTLAFERSWNACPGTDQLIVSATPTGLRRPAVARWGLIPHWADDAAIGAKLSNARSETAATKPAFRDAFRRHRCLVPTTGYYEWNPETKVPYFHVVDGGVPFAMAGLRSDWKTPEGQLRSTFAVLTTSPNALAATVHHRMPVIVDRDDYRAWLSPRSHRDDVVAMLSAFDENRMAQWPVSRDVNSTRNDGPTLVRRHDPLVQGTLF